MELHKSHYAIISALEDSDSLTYNDLANITGFSKSGLRGRIQELIAQGINIDKEVENGQIRLRYDKAKRVKDIGEAIPQFETTTQRYKSAQTFNNMRKEINHLKQGINPLKIIKNKTNREALLVLSDWHLGQKINHNEFVYNTQIAKQRVERLASDIIFILDHNDVSHLHIGMIGDMVDGDQIYKTHPFEIEMVAAEQVKAVTRLLVSLLNTLVDNGITVDVYAIRGNHGQVSYSTVYEDNWDNMVYSHLELVYDDSKDVQIYHGTHDELKFKIENRQVLLYHGNDLSTQISTSSGMNKFRGLVGKHRLKDGDVVLVGHYHTFGVEQDQNVVLVRNGSLTSTNLYAWKKNLFSQPTQTLLVFENQVQPTIYPIEVE